MKKKFATFTILFFLAAFSNASENQCILEPSKKVNFKNSESDDG
ncbi:MAG: hypothetical protein V4660_17940 [Pseudomonadota bacterium]